MSEKNTNQVTSKSKATASKRDYDTVLREAKESKETSNRLIQSRLDEGIKILKDEGKEKETIRNKLFEDWVRSGLCGRSSVIDALTRAFNPEVYAKAQERKKEQAEKKKILVDAATGEAIQEGVDGKKVDLSSMNAQELREYYANKANKNELASVNRAVAKSNKPNVVGKDNFDDEDDEDETVQEEQTVTNQGIKNVVIDHEDDINNLIQCLTKDNKGKPIILEVDTATWTVTNIRNGNGTLKKD